MRAYILFISLITLTVLTGCDDSAPEEIYKGPVTGQPCSEAYKYPSNVGKCLKAEPAQ